MSGALRTEAVEQPPEPFGPGAIPRFSDSDEKWTSLPREGADGYSSLREAPAPVAKPSRGHEPLSEPDRLQDESKRLARKARDAFRDACGATDPDGAEMNYLAMKEALRALWDYAKHRDLPFRDLLGLLDAATRHTELESFDDDQRGAIGDAFADLPVWLLDYDAVDAHIRKFAESGVDVIGPIRKTSAKRLKITIEEID